MVKNNSMKMRRTMKNKKYGDSECSYATFHGLHGWFKHLFEELGWMILAKSYGMTDKIMVYKHSLKRFKCAVEKKLHIIKDTDKKEDLRIMHHNITVLISHAEKDL